MTAPPPAARPYRVHLDVLAFTGSFWAPKVTGQRWADVALDAGQIETLTGGPDREKILKAAGFPLRPVLLWWAAATAVLTLVGFIPAVGAAVPAAAWTLGTGVLALVLGRRWRFLGRARRRIEHTLEVAAATDTAYWVTLHDTNWSRLHRIEAALTTLQAHAGSAFDDRARAAVASVIYPSPPPPPPAREPDTAPKGTSPKAKYRAALHGAFSELLRPPPAPPAADPVAALEAEAARFGGR